MAWEPRYSRRQVQEAVDRSRSLTQALLRLGLRPAGGNHETLRKLIAHYDISTAHFDPNWANRASRTSTATPLSEILVERSHYSRAYLKQRLYDEGVKSPRCEMCGIGDTWRGRRMGLILDHINGVPTDNRIENLRIVCPNCAATLDTHCGRKTSSNVNPDRAWSAARSSFPNTDLTATAHSAAACTARDHAHRSPTPAKSLAPPTTN